MSAKRSPPATKADLHAVAGRFEEKLEAVEGRFEEKLEAVEGRFEEKLEAVEGRFEEKLEAVEARLGEKMATKDDLRGMGVLMEKMDSKLDALIEGQDGMRKELVANITALDERHSQRLDDLEDVVRRHSHDIGAIQKRLRISK